MKSFWLAWQFLTRYPAPRYAQVSEQELGQAQVQYMNVGLLLGLILFAVGYLLHQLLLSELVIAAILLGLWVISSGGLHLDGLADTVDGWIGSQGDIKRGLEIMKDPVSGPMGVTAIVLLLLTKFALLTSVSVDNMALLILVPALARAVVPLLFLLLPYLRSSGLGKSLSLHISRLRFILYTGMAITVATYLLGVGVLWLASASFASILILTQVYKKQFGGVTGDMAGASIEIIEVILLFTLVLQS